jgi:hypothetical protein
MEIERPPASTLIKRLRDASRAKPRSMGFGRRQDEPAAPAMLLVGLLGAAIGIGAALSIGGGIFATTTAAALARVPALRDENLAKPAAPPHRTASAPGRG